MTDARDAVGRLRSAVGDGRLDQVCRDAGIELAVLFGSAVSEPDPGDVDLAIAFVDPAGRDLLAAVVALQALVGEAVDVLDLDRAGPVARQRALTRGELLVERRPGAFALRQMAAVREFIETAPFWAMDLELMAR